ncbi:MAG: AIPR family protein [Clostridium sp.]|nr:AIPR family protein [Clostridium sp.]
MSDNKSLLEIGGYKGLVNTYYKKIKEEICEIKEENDYKRDSHAFAHWFLTNIRGLSDILVQEMITDDYDDWAIDAINIDSDNDVIELYQFKLPNNENKIDGEISQEEVLKFLLGYKICSSGEIPERTNEALANKIKEIDEAEIYTYKLIYVSYNNGFGYHAKATMDLELDKIKSTGNQVTSIIYDKYKITNSYYLNTRKQKQFDIKLNQVANATGYIESDNSKCFNIYVKLDDIAKICDEYNDVIFDENVRLFHGLDNSYNKGIMDTAENDSENFHLYNNGIVIIASKVKNNDMKKEMRITNPKVVNGCQTMNSLLAKRNEILEECKKEELQGKRIINKDDVILEGMVPVKIIEVEDPEVRQNISIFLNSQTEIKDSYLISNLPIILNLEADISKRGYFLERQANQVKNIKMKKTKREIEDLFGVGNNKVINLDECIQVYSTFFEGMAPIAKLNKAKLFNVKSNLEKIFSTLNSEKVITSYEVYKRICEVITIYRRYRRNKGKKEIISYLGINESEISLYSFMNTADLFLLSLVSKEIELNICSYENIGKNKKINNYDEWNESIQLNLDIYIKEAIEIMKECVQADKSGNPPAVLTKNVTFHKQLIQKIMTK